MHSYWFASQQQRTLILHLDFIFRPLAVNAVVGEHVCLPGQLKLISNCCVHADQDRFLAADGKTSRTMYSVLIKGSLIATRSMSSRAKATLAQSLPILPNPVQTTRKHYHFQPCLQLFCLFRTSISVRLGTVARFFFLKDFNLSAEFPVLVGVMGFVNTPLMPILIFPSEPSISTEQPPSTQSLISNLYL